MLKNNSKTNVRSVDFQSTAKLSQSDLPQISIDDLSSLSLKNNLIIEVSMNDTAENVSMAKVSSEQSLLMLGFGPCIGMILYDQHSNTMYGVHLTPWQYKLKPHPIDYLYRKYLPEITAFSNIVSNIFTSRVSKYLDGVTTSNSEDLVLLTFGGLKIEPPSGAIDDSINQKNQSATERAIDYVMKRLNLVEDRIIRKDCWHDQSFASSSAIGVLAQPQTGIVQLMTAKDRSLDYQVVELISLNLSQ